MGKLYRDFPVTEEHWWNGISSFVLTDLPSSQEKFDPREEPDDTPGIISVDDIDFEYLNTEVQYIWATFQGSRIADGLISYP
jgi:hypothetical protein